MVLGFSRISFFLFGIVDSFFYTFASDKNLIIFLQGHYQCLLVAMETDCNLFLHVHVLPGTSAGAG